MFTDKKLNRMTFKNALLLITYTILLILCAMNYQSILAEVASFFNLIRPFIYGFAMAYIFNLPMKYFLKKLPKTITKGRTLLAAFCSLLSIAIIFTFIVSIVVPQLVDSIASLAETIPSYIEESKVLVDRLLTQYDISEELMQQIETYSGQIQQIALSIGSNALPSIINTLMGITTSIANLFMAVVIAVYLLISKEKLNRQVKDMCYAFLPEKANAYCLHIGELSNKTFSSFISGQLVEAIIIGVLCYIGCLVLKIPYAPIVSVVIGCTNIIPIFGPIIGTAVCGVLILFVSPLQAVIFVIFGICLQQFESNLIYPRVVGSSVGLSGLWVLFAITVGGGMFGLMGMVLGLPFFAVAYTLLRETMKRRIAEKKTRITNEVVKEVE